jgi:hypothetical protein
MRFCGHCNVCALGAGAATVAAATVPGRCSHVFCILRWIKPLCMPRSLLCECWMRTMLRATDMTARSPTHTSLHVFGYGVLKASCADTNKLDHPVAVKSACHLAGQDLLQSCLETSTSEQQIQGGFQVFGILCDNMLRQAAARLRVLAVPCSTTHIQPSTQALAAAQAEVASTSGRTALKAYVRPYSAVAEQASEDELVIDSSAVEVGCSWHDLQLHRMATVTAAAHGRVAQVMLLLQLHACTAAAAGGGPLHLSPPAASWKATITAAAAHHLVVQPQCSSCTRVLHSRCSY